MRRRGWWALEVALLVSWAFAVPVRAADPDNDKPAPADKNGESKGWFPGLFKKDIKIEDKNPEFHKGKEPTLQEAVAPRRNDGAVQRAREEQTMLRRLEVCDQLKWIALQKKDDELLRQAEELDLRVQALYNRRTADLPSGRVARNLDDDHADKPASRVAKEDKP